MFAVFESVKQHKIIKIIKQILNNKFFPFFTAGISILSYFFKFDLLCIYNIALTFTLICIFCDDLSPAISVALFLNTMVSPKEGGSSAYFTQPHILPQIIILIVLSACSLIYRLIRIFAIKKFKITPVFWGLCGLSIALMLNGILSTNATTKNFLFGLILTFCFLVVFVVVKDDIAVDEDAFKRVAYAFIAFSLLLVIELAHKYITTSDIISNGNINRWLLEFGWGTRTTFGALAVICLPASTFLIRKEKYGYIFTIYLLIILAAIILSFARQAIIVAIIISPACIYLSIKNCKFKKFNICLYIASFIIVTTIFLTVFSSTWKYILELFKSIKTPDGEWDGTDRTKLWAIALENFRLNPIFGIGFFFDTFLPDYIGIAIYPEMYHNTFIELLGACGIVGLMTYTVHRVQTIQSYIKNITLERTFIALTVLTLLIDCMFDNHIFKIMPTIVYSMLIAMLIKSEKRTDEITPLK